VACTVAFCATASGLHAPRFCNFSQHLCDRCPATRVTAPPASSASRRVAAALSRQALDCQQGESSRRCGRSATTHSRRDRLPRLPSRVRPPARAPAVLDAISPVVVVDRTGGISISRRLAQPDARSLWRAPSSDGITSRSIHNSPCSPLRAQPSANRDCTESPTILRCAWGCTRASRVPPTHRVLERSGRRCSRTPCPGPRSSSTAVSIVYYTRLGRLSGLPQGRSASAPHDCGRASRRSCPVFDGTTRTGPRAWGGAFWTPISRSASPQAKSSRGPLRPHEIHLSSPGSSPRPSGIELRHAQG